MDHASKVSDSARRSSTALGGARAGADLPQAARIRMALLGAGGRMGSRIRALALADPRVEVVCTIGRASRPAAEAFDVLIDFSSPEAVSTGLGLAVERGAALLVGTTGLGQSQVADLRGAAARVPVLLAPNTSLGIAVLRHLVREAVRLLPGFDVDIVESHHAAKRDAPSGTALALAAAVESAGGHMPRERVHALRGGDIVGEHTVQLAGPGETIRLEHSAVSRDLFALGALRAAIWLAGREPGWYGMDDVVGLGASKSPSAIS